MLSPHRMLLLRQVAQSGSIAAAARVLGYTQPALAHHLKALDREAGMKLTHRVGRVVRLTDAGELIARRADKIYRELVEAEDEVGSLIRLEQGVVRVAAFPSFAGSVLPQALVALQQRHPGIEVRLLEAEPPEAFALLASGACDIAVIFSDPELPDDEVASRFARLPYTRDSLRLVLPAGHRLLAGNTDVNAAALNLAAVADEPWFGGCPRCQSQLHRLAGEAGFRPDVRYESDDFVAVQRFVAMGLAVALLPQLALDLHLDPGVVAVPLPDDVHRLIQLISPVVPSPASQAVIDAMTLVRPAGPMSKSLPHVQNG